MQVVAYLFLVIDHFKKHVIPFFTSYYILQNTGTYKNVQYFKMF